MKSVKLNKKELLSIVRENKAKHIAEYNEAVKDYIEAARTIVNYNVSQINEGTLVSIAKCKLIPTAPTSYEDEYDRAIRMLELSIEKEIELEADVFNQLVLDEWQWKNNFAVMASTYKAFQ
jgi:predicted glycosyltransferase